jgi:cytochrome b
LISENQPPSSYSDEPVRVRVWDLFVRAVHWLLVLLMVFSWISAKNGWLGWHKVSGYAILCLIVFRIYWGFCGSSTARFSHFLRGPKAAGRYLRTLFARDGRHAFLGHNPLGGWNVIALLSLLLLQTGSGLFAVDIDGLESGPLAKYVSFETGRRLAGLHGSVFNILLLLIALHIAAVLGHLVYQRENLVAPMLTGIKRVPRAHVQIIAFASPRRALVGLAAIILSIVVLAVWL